MVVAHPALHRELPEYQSVCSSAVTWKANDKEDDKKKCKGMANVGERRNHITHLLERSLCCVCVCVQETGIPLRRRNDRLSRAGPGLTNTPQSPSLTDPLLIRPLPSDSIAKSSPPRRVQVPETSDGLPLPGGLSKWRRRALIVCCLLVWTRSFDKSTSPSSSSSEDES